MTRIAIHVDKGIAMTRDLRGCPIVGPFQFGASRFVPEDSTAPGSGDGTFVYEGEWVVPPRSESQPC
jgi:hypothetical protein